VGFEILIFPKNNETNNTKKKEKYFFDFWARQGLTLVLRILIKDEKLGLHSSLKKMIWKTIWKKKDLNFFVVNLTRTGLAPTYPTVENQGSRSSKKKTLCLKMLMFFYFENFIFFG